MVKRRFKLSNLQPIVTLDDFLGTYAKQSSGYAQEAAEFLQSKGILPLTYQSHLLPELNIIGAWLLWSGSISFRRWQYSSLIVLNDSRYFENLKKTSEALELKLESVDKDGRYIHFGENGSPYSRLLHLMGVMAAESPHTGRRDRKTLHDVHLPHYLMQFCQRSRYNELRFSEKDLAKKLLIDYAKVILFSKFGSTRESYRIELIKNKESKDAVRELGREVVDLFNTIFPQVDLDYCQIKTSSDSKNYRGAIYFGFEQVLNIASYGLLKLGISFNTDYYYPQPNDKISPKQFFKKK